MLLMYHNNLDSQFKAMREHPEKKKKLDIELPVAYVLKDKVYFFDYIVESIRRPNNELIETVNIEEAIQHYSKDPETWNQKMRHIC